MNQGTATVGKAPDVNPSQRPPLENPESVRIRGLVITSFWLVVIFLGLPTWWYTTSIHRARLPLREMLEWADGKACRPTFPLQIAIEAPSLQESEALNLVRMTQHALDDLNTFSAHHLRLRLAKTLSLSRGINYTMGENEEVEIGNILEVKKLDSSLEEAMTVRLLRQDGITTAWAELRSHSTILDVNYAPNHVPSVSSSSSMLASLIANKLQELFVEEQAIIEYILTSNQSTGSTHQTSGRPSQMSQSAGSTSKELKYRPNRPLNPELAARLASRMTRSLKYAPKYHITMSLFTPSATPSSWDIEPALAEYFAPLLDSISVISNFTVDTQVQLHAIFSPSVHLPEHDEEKGLWTLREEDLSGFINAAEWPLSPSIGVGPTLNFVLYVPDRANTPLVIKGNGASSWLIPQWGGVFILNPQQDSNETTHATLSKESIRPALLTFSHQLLSFLGAPQSPPSLPLQLQTLTRIQAASLLLSASSTMGSLARLTVALPSIAIPETVSAAVDKTLAHLRKTCDTLKDGRFKDALKNARIAEVEAERGFFEKSMVGQVYFPDEHKIAVYLPLLGPIGVPLLMSGSKELKRLFYAWKARRSHP